LPTTSINVGLARSMARFAAKLFLRGPGMHHHGVAHGGVFKALLLVGVARHANLAADVVRGTRVSVTDRLFGCVARENPIRTGQDCECDAEYDRCISHRASSKLTVRASCETWASCISSSRIRSCNQARSVSSVSCSVP